MVNGWLFPIALPQPHIIFPGPQRRPMQTVRIQVLDPDLDPQRTRFAAFSAVSCLDLMGCSRDFMGVGWNGDR